MTTFNSLFADQIAEYNGQYDIYEKLDNDVVE